MKQLPFLLLVLLLAINSKVSLAQSDYLDFDKESFLIGTLSDFKGREQVFSKGINDAYFERVDIYAQQEKRIAYLINFLFKEEYPDIEFNNNGPLRRLQIHSSALSKLIDSYYTYQPAENSTTQDEGMHIGTLDPEKFKTPKQKLSFLAGAYLRYGNIKHNDSMEEPQYIYDIPNSLSKTKICEAFLAELGCTNIQEVTNEYMPTKIEVHFIPSEQILKMIETIESVSKEILSPNYIPR